MRYKKALWASTAILFVAMIVIVTLLSRPPEPLLGVRFLCYTNNAKGELSALLEVTNRTNLRIARNSCRITHHPGPSYHGEPLFWYLAQDVRSHILETNATERFLITFDPNPMARWRATAVYGRNPTTLEWRMQRWIDWLNQWRLAPAALRRWSEVRSQGEASTEWIDRPTTNQTLTIPHTK